eukprot:374360-Prymnesium_polylepis.1
MDEFTRLVEEDLEAAAQADVDEEEDEEEARLREAVAVARSLEGGLEHLKRKVAAARLPAGWTEVPADGGE